MQGTSHKAQTRSNELGFDSHTQQPPAASEGPQEPQESCVQFAARSSRISLMPNLSARALRLASSSGLCTPRPVSARSGVYPRPAGAGESWTHSAGAANRLARSAFFASSADGLFKPNRSALCARQRTRQTIPHAQSPQARRLRRGACSHLVEGLLVCRRHSLLSLLAASTAALSLPLFALALCAANARGQLVQYRAPPSTGNGGGGHETHSWAAGCTGSRTAPPSSA